MKAYYKEEDKGEAAEKGSTTKEAATHIGVYLESLIREVFCMVFCMVNLLLLILNAMMLMSIKDGLSKYPSFSSSSHLSRMLPMYP